MVAIFELILMFTTDICCFRHFAAFRPSTIH